MALVVEDGTGKANANAFVDAAAVSSYATEVGNTAWDAADPADQDAAIVRATLYLRNEQRYPYRGLKASTTQRLPWPRVGATERRGGEIGSTTIPTALKDACCELALRELARPGSLQPDAPRGGAIRSETVGPISTTYADDASTETVIRTVAGLLEPLLRCEGDLDPVPYVGGAEGDPYFSAGMLGFGGDS